MVLWFVAFAVIVVHAVFDSPAMDYRFVVLGALAPVVELMLGRPLLLHTLVGSVAALVVVAFVTRGRRLDARRFVGIPIGMFLHLVADGTWSRAELFWWPFLGGDALGTGQVPERAHLAASLMLEIVGVAGVAWIVSAFGLTAPAARARFVRTGRLARARGSR